MIKCQHISPNNPYPQQVVIDLQKKKSHNQEEMDLSPSDAVSHLEAAQSRATTLIPKRKGLEGIEKINSTPQSVWDKSNPLNLEGLITEQGLHWSIFFFLPAALQPPGLLGKTFRHTSDAA